MRNITKGGAEHEASGIDAMLNSFQEMAKVSIWDLRVSARARMMSANGKSGIWPMP